jgi:hypothetical protein
LQWGHLNVCASRRPGGSLLEIGEMVHGNEQSAKRDLAVPGLKLRSFGALPAPQDDSSLKWSEWLGVC